MVASSKENATELSNLLTEDEINEACGRYIDFDFIFLNTLALFGIDCTHLDNDCDLILKKLDYLFTKKPVKAGAEK